LLGHPSPNPEALLFYEWDVSEIDIDNVIFPVTYHFLLKSRELPGLVSRRKIDSQRQLEYRIWNRGSGVVRWLLGATSRGPVGRHR
jgi:hypothetical protein